VPADTTSALRTGLIRPWAGRPARKVQNGGDGSSGSLPGGKEESPV
jgi:hypothetical protein